MSAIVPVFLYLAHVDSYSSKRSYQKKYHWKRSIPIYRRQALHTMHRPRIYSGVVLECHNDQSIHQQCWDGLKVTPHQNLLAKKAVNQIFFKPGPFVKLTKSLVIDKPN